MRTRRQLTFESLEARHALSASSVLATFLASGADGPAIANVTPADSSSAAAAAAATSAQSGTQQPISASAPRLDLYLSSTGSNLTVSDRWDWLLNTSWYVPTENLLAYATNSQLVNPSPISDQTLWNFTESSNGQIAGTTMVKTSLNADVSNMTFTGLITDGGQVRMQFSGGSSSGTTGIGQMRFVNGAWQVEMQMLTGDGLTITHWAYMAQQTPGTTPPDPTAPPPDPATVAPDPDLLSNEWRWLAGTQWAITDTALFGNAAAGVFTITTYRNGYFWGSGNAGQPFNVLGSVTPEGNLLLAVSQPGGQPTVRTGILEQTSTGGRMTLRTYEGQPAVGTAWTISVPSTPTVGPIDPGLRALMGSATHLGSS